MAASGGLRPQTIIALDIRFWFATQSQWSPLVHVNMHCRAVDVRPTNRLSVDQTMKKIQHMGLGRDALGNGHFHGDQHRLFILMQNQRQDLDHLPVTAGLAQHEVLQLFECRREFREGRTVPECPWLALKDGQVMPPVVNRAWRKLVAALDHPHMLTQDLTLRSDHRPVRINAQTDGTARK